MSDEVTHLVNVVSPRRAVLSVGPRERKGWTYGVVARRRGLHKFGPLHLEAGDAFGLAHLRGTSTLQSGLIVYPRIHALEDLGLPSSLPFGEVQTPTRFFDDPAHTIGTRPYQAGDPYKSIHWKVSARAGVAREYQPTIAVDVHLPQSQRSGVRAASAQYYPNWQSKRRRPSLRPRATARAWAL